MMTMLKRLVFITPLIVTLAACSPRASFIPEREELPDAVLGTPYFHKVNIVGGRVIKMKEPVSGKIEPQDSGIYMQNCRLPDRVITDKTTMLVNGNCVEIKGTPVRTGTVTVTLHGGLYGSMLVSAGSFEKTYRIRIVAGQKE